MSEIQHLRNNMSASVVNAVEDFAFINFKIFPNPGVIPPDIAGGTLNINFRCCLLAHTFFQFLICTFHHVNLCWLLSLYIGLCSVKHALQNTQNDCHQWLSDSSRVHQIRFRPQHRPGPRSGSSRRSPRPPCRHGRKTPNPPYHTPSTPS